MIERADDVSADAAPDRTGSAIRLGPAIGTWALAFAVGSVVLAPLVLIGLGVDDFDDLSIGMIAIGALVGWAVYLVALAVASRRFGTSVPIVDYAARFRPVDLIGVPLGVLTQLALIPLLYVPLQELWPDTFSDERLEERAQELVDSAGGASIVLLVVVVVVGAPIVEELVYRGLLQRSLTAAIGPMLGLPVAALWFALVHPSPVEYPGLALAGLVFGAGVVVTGRIGMSIVTHAAFNAAGLSLVLGAAW